MSNGETVVLAAWLVLLLAIWAWLQVVGTAHEPRVSIRSEIGAIVCHVPLDPSNRWLTIGVVGHLSHGIQLDGTRLDPISSRLDLPPLDCEDGEDVVTGYCALEAASHRLFRVSIPLSCR